MVNIKKLFISLFLVSTICFCMSNASVSPENFVALPLPKNSYSVPGTENWTNEQDNFTQLIHIVNGSTFAEPYNLIDNTRTFEKILNDVGVGKFKVLSTQFNRPFNLVGVLVQNVQSFALKRFSHVSLIVDKFVITEVRIVNDPDFTSVSFVKGLDTLQPDSQFRIKNPLSLFAPYDTSDNENEITNSDFTLLAEVMTEKYDKLKNFY